MVQRPNNPANSDSKGDPFAKARELQRGLYVAAKRQPERRFHALYHRIWRSDVLLEAWRRVRANKGAAGVDALTLAEVEQYGVERFLEELGVAPASCLVFEDTDMGIQAATAAGMASVKVPSPMERALAR